jgi:DNA processing protein
MSAPSADITQRAWAYLSRVAEPPCPQLAVLAARYGPVEAAARIRAGLRDDDAPEGLAERVEARRHIDCAAQDLDILSRRGGRLITPDDEEWPYLAFMGFDSDQVRKKPNGHLPLVLWASGPARLDEVSMRSAAIVGTRASSSYGEYVAGDLAAGLVESEVAVISGGAYGIDGAAHRATLAASGETVAVLAGGIDIPYPAGHSALLHRIAGSGLLVTEYPPGVRPARHRFLTRNRLVAGMGRATVVVEAGLRSGAANTASWAEAMGRVVCAVPGPVTSASSAGCHHLLRNGAVLVTRAAEVVEIVGQIGELADDPEHPQTPLDALTDTQRQVYEALPRRGMRSVEQIAVGSGLPIAQVLGPLALLEVAGLIEQGDGGWRLVRGSAGRPS